MKTRVSTLQELKQAGQKFACLTSYDAITAKIFDAAGIRIILVGDSAANIVLGYTTTLPITLEEMIPFARAVSGAVHSALVVVDLPFGSYEAGPEIALSSAIRIMKEASVDGVKLEGGSERVPQIEALVSAGIPVMGHLGFTPQSVHQLGGYRIQGRGESAAELLQAAKDLEAAGCFAIVLEMIPRSLAGMITSALTIPTIGIGAGPETDGQILVWTDMAGLTEKVPTFVKTYESLGSRLSSAARNFNEEVSSGSFPSEAQSFD